MATKNKDKNYIDPNKIERQEYCDEYNGKVAVCKMDNYIEDIVRFNTFHNLHKKLNKLLLSSFLVFIGGMFALTQNSTSLAIIFFVATPLFPIILIFIQRISLRTQLQKDDEFLKTNHIYEFTEEEFFAITKCGKRVASVKIDYEKLSDCYETATCFYIYISRGSAFVLNKNKFVYGESAVFSEFLKRKVGAKFKVTRGKKKAKRRVS